MSANLDFSAVLTSLTAKGAAALREAAVVTAEEMEVSGVVAVLARTGMLESLQAVGQGARPAFVELAQRKARTAFNMGRSTSNQRNRMAERGQGREDFMGVVECLLKGGVAIFADQRCSILIGAIGFSGGGEDEDQEICMRAVEMVGFFTDL